MGTLIVAAVFAGYAVQFAAALIVVLNHAQDKVKSRPGQLMR